MLGVLGGWIVSMISYPLSLANWKAGHHQTFLYLFHPCGVSNPMISMAVLWLEPCSQEGQAPLWGQREMAVHGVIMWLSGGHRAGKAVKARDQLLLT